MCGKQRSYKSFAFVSAVTKGVTGAFFVSAANTRLSSELEKCGGKRALVGQEHGLGRANHKSL
jgi:hypothetical protein